MIRSGAARVLVALLIALPAAGCGPRPAIPAERLPEGFPVMPGAEALPLATGDLVGHWRVDEVGPAVYQYYLAALPAAGYRALQAAAGIRFEDRDGVAWQLDLTALGGPFDGTEIRLGRPRP
jgi:hypothetical protein